MSAPVRLSPQQLDVLRLLARGNPRKRVARILGVTPHTVRTYTVRIHRALGTSGVLVEAMLRAHALGLIDLGEIAREMEASR